MIKRHSPQGGFTLTEISIVLGITGLILAAVWNAGNSVNESFKQQKAQTQILYILNQVAQYGGWSAVPNGADQAVIVSLNLIPPEAVSNDVTFCANTGGAPPCGMNPWGGNLVVGTIGTGGEGMGLNLGEGVIYLTGVSESGCIRFFMSITKGVTNWMQATAIGASTNPQTLIDPPVQGQPAPTLIAIPAAGATPADINDLCSGIGALGAGAAIGVLF